MQVSSTLVFEKEKVETLKLISAILCGITIAVGILILIGWQFDISILKNNFYNLVPVNPLTAVLFILVGISALMLSRDQTNTNIYIVAKIIAFVVLLVGASKMISIFGYPDLPIDKILFHNQIIDTDPTNLVSPTTAINFVLVGLALCAIDFKGEFLRNPNHFLIMLSLSVIMLTLLGYLYGVIYLYEISHARYYPMALYTAANFLILDTAILLMRPNEGFVKLAFNKGPAGNTLRRLIPTILFISVTLGWLRFYAQQAGILNYELLVTLTTTLFFFITAIIILWNAGSLFSIDEQRKNASRQLIQKEILFDSMISSMGEAIMAVDNNFKLLVANKAASKLIGIKQEDMINHDFRQYVTFMKNGQPLSLKARMDEIGTKIAGINVLSIRDDLYMKNAAGKIFPITGVITQLKSGTNVLGFVIAFNDISIDKEIDAVKTQFASLASHQLRTPLSTINWYTEMLQNGDAGEITAQQMKYLDEIMSANKRMVDLVNSLLSVAQIEQGLISEGPVNINPLQVVQVVLDELRGKISDKKLTIEVIHAHEIPTLLSNSSYLRMIFQNLITNAINYSSKAGVVKINLSTAKNTLFFRISDTGAGIPDSAKSRIFLKLFRADNARRTNPNGNGLGLYIVKLIVNRMGGKIRFESKENEGTTFYVSLPYKLARKNISEQ